MDVIDEALRGGDPARHLEERCRQQLVEAERAAEEAQAEVPGFIESTLERHEVHLKEITALNGDLESLDASLNEITKSSEEMVECSRLEAAKCKALDDLAVAIVPFVYVANALKRSDDLNDLSFPQMETTLATLEAAVQTAQESARSQLVRAVPELEERSDQVKALMKSQYLDMFEVRPESLTVKLKSTDSKTTPKAAALSLSNVDLLKDAIESIVSELLRNDVAANLSRATLCFENETETSYTLEWSQGEDSGELLEFDLDDIENADDNEVDAMSEHLDISNAASRALRVYDVLRLKLVGDAFSRELAFALQSWFCNEVLPSSVVMTNRRGTSTSTQPFSDSLRSRVSAVSACANVIQSAIRTRGVHSFVLIVEMDSLESKVGSECRAQAVLKTRRAIANFSNAEHDNEEIVECPIAAIKYIPPVERSPEYFPPCLVTKTSVIVHETFMTTQHDARNAEKGGSLGISGAMDAAALECLRSYREDIPVQYGDELRASLRLKALYYTDCMMLAHSCRLSAQEGRNSSQNMVEEAGNLESAAQKAMTVIRRTAERRLQENLNAACRKGALGAYGTLTRIQRSSALSAAFHAMREVVTVFAQIVPTELAEVAACRLIEKYLTKLCDEVVALPEISAEGCEQIDNILGDADRNVASLMKLVEGMEKIRAGAPPPSAVQQMHICLRRLRAIREILNAKMEDIVRSFESGVLEGLVSREEVQHFIRAIFEDTQLRASFVSRLDISSSQAGDVQQPSEDWNSSNW